MPADTNDTYAIEGCGSHHHITALSYFTFVTSVVLITLTIPLNGAIIITFIKKKKLLKKTFFHKTIINIAVADFLTGFFSDITAISFHLKEALDIYSPRYELVFLHCSLFFINGVSILTMVLCCLERVIALIRPFKHRHGIGKYRTIMAICLTWILAALLVIPYFFLGYIKYLIIFSYFTVIVAAISLVITAIVYKVRLSQNFSVSAVTSEDQIKNGLQKKEERKRSLKDTFNLNVRLRNYKKKEKDSHTSSTKQRAIKSFAIMLAVFILTYLPACIMTAYMSLCSECDCIFIHVLRDLTFICILASAVLRPLNFILVLKTLRKNILHVICFKNNLSDSTASS